VDRVIDNGTQYRGRPYKFLTPQGNIMDCSGFMLYIYSLEGIKLPRTSRQQSAFCTQVSTSDIRKGDLLFFAGSSSNSKTVGHVSMVIDVNGGTLQMMHSSSRGHRDRRNFRTITIPTRFLHAGRIPQLESLIQEQCHPGRLLTRRHTLTHVGYVVFHRVVQSQ
jgi:cell wall-associated NlpC family hydrolase